MRATTHASIRGSFTTDFFGLLLNGDQRRGVLTELCFGGRGCGHEEIRAMAAPKLAPSLLPSLSVNLSSIEARGGMLCI